MLQRLHKVGSFNVLQHVEMGTKPCMFIILYTMNPHLASTPIGFESVRGIVNEKPRIQHAGGQCHMLAKQCACKEVTAVIVEYASCTCVCMIRTHPHVHTKYTLKLNDTKNIGTIKPKNFFNSFLSSLGTGLTGTAAGFLPPLALFACVVSVSLAAPRFRFGLASGVWAGLALLDFLLGDLQEGEHLAFDFGAAFAFAFDFGAFWALDFGVALALVCRWAGF